jgi:hypothetical protein
MRVGGQSRNKSAIKVALERRYRDYAQDGPLTTSQMTEALKKLRQLTPSGPRDIVNVDKTIYETMRNAGEIEIVFDRRLADRLKVMLFIANGGWSMDPYVDVVQTLFHYANASFKDLKIFIFTTRSTAASGPIPNGSSSPNTWTTLSAGTGDPGHHRGGCQHGPVRAHACQRRHLRGCQAHRGQRGPPALRGEHLPPLRLAQPHAVPGVGTHVDHECDP